MDIDILISKVQLKPPIWDKRLKVYSNRKVVGACWREISKEIGVQDEVLRKKWKYLRDQFSVEAGKVKHSRSGVAGDSSYEPKWPYYKSLQFLNDVIKPRASSKSIKYEEFSDEEDSQMVFDDDNHETASVSSSIASMENVSEKLEIVLNDSVPFNKVSGNNVESEGRNILKRKRPDTNSKDNEKLPEHENQKVELVQHVVQRESDNDDMLFFRSLMPFVEKIPQNLKLRFRNRIQAVVEEFAFG